jgi:hypothetical protein
MIDIQEKKRKIISFLETNGPSLPVRIAKTIEMDPVFASAILSELLGAGQIKTSHIKVGSSPLYLLAGQEQRLEEYIENLKPIEREAFLKLKKQKIILDEEEPPVIRVALRNVKDFAIPSETEGKIIWKYAFASDEELNNTQNPEEEIKEDKVTEEVEEEEIKEDEIKEAEEEEIKEDEIKEVEEEEIKEDEIKEVEEEEIKEDEIKEVEEEEIKEDEIKEVENIFENKEKEDKKHTVKKTFLDQVEEFLSENGTKINSILEVDKKKVIAETKSENQKALLFAFNKKKISEEELMKCYKKAKEKNLSYHIITTGEPTKKMSETIDAYKSLIKIDQLDEE